MVNYFSQFYINPNSFILFVSIRDYQQQLQNRSTTCVATVVHFLEKIKKHQHLNAFTEVYEKEALAQASQLDEKISNGKIVSQLDGVVIAIKDVICYKDHKVTAASKILVGFLSVYSATAVKRLQEAGAIIIGSCNCDEFAMGSTNENSAYGKVLNGLDETKVPGGSSGGSAVAVQAEMCMLSLGSDTGGSVRQPADFCGIIGIKPTYGRISRYGLIAYASSFDQIGIFGNWIDDVALVLEIISGPDEFDSTALNNTLPVFSNNNIELEKQSSANEFSSEKQNKKYRIAYFEEAINHPSLDTEIATTIKNSLQQLKTDGHIVEAVSFDLLDYVVPTYYVLTTAEASTNLSRFDGVRYGHRTQTAIKDLTDFYKKNRSEGFGKEVQRRIMLGTFVLSAGYFDAYFGKAQQVRRLLINKTAEIFATYDAIILPTAPTTAFAFGEKTNDPVAMYLADIYTVFANLTGIPGISLPLFWHSNGMPFGLQIMANKEEEIILIQLSAVLMERFKNK